jgi:hypothetical protein
MAPRTCPQKKNPHTDALQQLMITELQQTGNPPSARPPMVVAAGAAGAAEAVGAAGAEGVAGVAAEAAVPALGEDEAALSWRASASRELAGSAAAPETGASVPEDEARAAAKGTPSLALEDSHASLWSRHETDLHGVRAPANDVDMTEAGAETAASSAPPPACEAPPASSPTRIHFFSPFADADGATRGAEELQHEASAEPKEPDAVTDAAIDGASIAALDVGEGTNRDADLESAENDDLGDDLTQAAIEFMDQDDDMPVSTHPTEQPHLYAQQEEENVTQVSAVA